MSKTLNLEEQNELLDILKNRFLKHPKRHPKMIWDDVENQLLKNKKALWSLFQMEQTGGEPDVLFHDTKTNQFIFFDCSAESPKGRRSICYDRSAQESRKEFAPENNAIDMASEMGIEILDENDYKTLQEVGIFDAKTSSWIKTPENIRALGGALFADYRYSHVFVYHNGAQSYYAARGFRGKLKV